MSVRVVLLRTNSTTSDPRVLKEARSLSRAGLRKVIVLAWDREACRNVQELIGLATVKRLPLKAPYRSFKLVLYLPIFWAWVCLQLLVLRAQIVHSIDEDTIIPAYIYRNFFSRRSRLIFEVCDLYSEALFPSNRIFSLLRVFLKKMETIFAWKADCLIVTSKHQAQSLRNKQTVRIIPNCPDESFLAQDLVIQSKAVKSCKFRVVHAGTLREDYGVELLCKACEDLEGVELIFAGRLSDRDLMREVEKKPNTQYLGELTYGQALALEATADAIPILCDPKRKAARGVSPNRLFEAMMLGVPIIVTSDLQAASDVVRDVQCGFVVKYDVNAIREAIISLKENKEQAYSMGHRGLRAFQNTYNWKNREKELWETYDLLIKSM